MNNNSINNKKARKGKNKNKNKSGIRLPSTRRVSNLGPQVMTFNRSSPGRVRVKTSFPLTNGSSTAAISYPGFASWNGQARAVLAPFQFFRVTELTSTVFVGGGAISAYTVAFNVSNTAYADTSSGTVLDDDYSAFANSVNQPMLVVGNRYWRDTARPWYYSIDQSSGLPVVTDLSQGSLSYFGAGGAAADTVIGTAVIEMVIEFHTLN